MDNFGNLWDFGTILDHFGTILEHFGTNSSPVKGLDHHASSVDPESPILLNEGIYLRSYPYIIYIIFLN